jgi:hypothetical protein
MPPWVPMRELTRRWEKGYCKDNTNFRFRPIIFRVWKKVIVLTGLAELEDWAILKDWDK